MFYIGMAVVIVVLSGLVIWSDERARQQRRGHNSFYQD